VCGRRVDGRGVGGVEDGDVGRRWQMRACWSRRCGRDVPDPVPVVVPVFVRVPAG
jgi:hypothetical protein